MDGDAGVLLSNGMRLRLGYSEQEYKDLFCSKCDARCCKHGVALSFKDPAEFKKVAKLAWELGVNVPITIGGNDEWIMSLNVPCGFLDESDNCLIYLNRPMTCRKFYCEKGLKLPKSRKA